jgi:hypothetical protein
LPIRDFSAILHFAFLILPFSIALRRNQTTLANSRQLAQNSNFLSAQGEALELPEDVALLHLAKLLQECTE